MQVIFMAKKIINTVKDFADKKIGGFSLTDAFITAVLKSISESALMPFVGNSTLRSGAWKIGGALVLPQARKLWGNKNFHKVVKFETAALAIDGTEDIARAFLRRVGGGQQNNGRGEM